MNRLGNQYFAETMVLMALGVTLIVIFGCLIHRSIESQLKQQLGVPPNSEPQENSNSRLQLDGTLQSEKHDLLSCVREPPVDVRSDE